MQDEIQVLFDALWQDYTQRLCPQAAKIQALFKQDAPVNNDHIALRTFALPAIGLNPIAAPFIALGYKAKGEYVFKKKRLYARHYVHPNPIFPKVFISELDLEACSKNLKDTVKALTLDTQLPKDGRFLYQGRPWSLEFSTYQALLAESEYAAWVAAHGFGANHFTIDVNALKSHNSLASVNQLLKANGFCLNEVGGEIKGGKEVYLAQSSTLADEVPVVFSEGTYPILGGFYEFAERFALPSGELYQGFVEASADKIFESTNKSE